MQPARPVIRPALPGDAAAMAQVFIRAWRQAYPGVVPDSVLAGLDHDKTARWLAELIERRAQGATDVGERAGQVIGFVRYGKSPEDRASGYVFGLYVDPGAAGQGAGQALLRHAEQQLADQGCSNVALHVFEANERARRFYARAGFEPDGSSRVEPEYEANEVRLVKPLALSWPVPPPRLAVTYHELPERPADGYPAVSQLLLRHLAAGFPPGLALQVRSSSATSYQAAGGWAKLSRAAAADREVPVPAEAGTLFDLASLTKVVATLPLVLLLHQRGKWSIDDPVARWLPGAPASPVTISDCLLHIAGLVPFRQYYLTCASPAEIRQAVIAELADAAVGPVSYSDVGFMLLGWAIESCAGEPLAELFAREIAGPLGMASTGYLPHAPLEQIAATEADGDQRARPALAWGEVHDGNAFALGGVSGHAGLFGTAADLGRFAAALLEPDRHPVLSAPTIALMTSRHAGSDPEARVLGWRVRPGQWGSWPDGTIWHTGFTGTSMLIAPALNTVVVLLTNAVHPHRRLAQTGQFRAEAHQAVLAALQADAR